MFICVSGRKAQEVDMMYVQGSIIDMYVVYLKHVHSTPYLTVCGIKFVWSCKYVATPTID